MGFSEHEASQVSLAIDEALSNIYRHGYEGNQLGTVDFSFDSQTSPEVEVRITIIDKGKQVPLEQIESRELSEVRPGGLGVHLIKTIMDKATWSHAEHGMKLEVVKRKASVPNETLSEKEHKHVT